MHFFCTFAPAKKSKENEQNHLIMKYTNILKTNLMRATMTLALIITCATAWAASGNWSSYKASSFSSASGTTINITSSAELALLAYNVTALGEDYSGYTINLTTNLDMNAHYWDMPIGLYDDTHDNTFMGTFDGGNHTISGIYTSNSTSNYQGLFGFVGRSFSYDDPNVPSQSGTVRNLTLASSTITGKENVGGIAAYLWNGTISNCHVLSSVSIQAGSSNSKYHGGIVGQINPGQISQSNSNYNSATVQNCTCGASITSGSYSGCSDYGGIVGSYNRNTSTLTGCFYNGTSISANSNKGAIIGSCTTTSGISNCYYYYPSSINGIGSGGSVGTVKQVYKLTLGTSDLTISSSPTYIFNGTNYYATGAVTTSSNTQYITALTATSGSINNVTYSHDRRTAYFGFGSDATVTATFATGGLCGTNAWWDLSDDGTVLTISGSGAMNDYSYTTVNSLWRTTAPWGWQELTTVIIGDGITSIGNYAFIGCQNVASVTIGSSVQSIGIAAINHCDQMTTITLPASVNTIAYAAFENCQALTTIYINNTGAVSLTGSNNNHFNAPNLQHIVFSTLNGALANTTGHWTHYAEECCVKLGNQFFHATNEGGTPAYQIATEQDLRNLATAVNSDQQSCYGLTFRQTADIDLGSTNFTWIYREFKGTYDGGNYTISNLNISNSNMNVGLFTEVSGTVKNVRLINPEVETSWDFTTNVGSLIGYLRGRMENCYAVSPTVSSPNCSWARLGALVGHSYTGTISNSYYIKGTGNATKGIGFNENGTGDVLPVYTLTLGEGITTSTNPTLNYNGTNYYSGTIILPAAPAGYVYNYTVNGSAINGNTFTISEDATVARTIAPDPTHFSQSGNEYTIHTATGWDVFCDMLENGETFSGKIVKLGANIEVSRMAGTYSATTNSGHAFSGAFNGQNNTLTFSCTAADNYVAPFAYLSGTSAAHASISDLNVVTNITATNYRHIAGLVALHMGYVDVTNCHAQVTLSANIGSNNTDLYPAGLVSQTDISGRLTISNCTTTGTIATDGKYAAGLVGVVQGTASIEDCVSSVTINSSTNGDGTHGGLVAVTQTNSTTTIEGCLFNGKLLSVGTTDTGNCGGFVGWRNSTLTISNSLYAPATLTGNEHEVVAGTGDYPSCTFARNWTGTPTNSYYTRALNTEQGKQQRSITAGSNVTINAIALTGNTTTYNVSGITAYSNGGLSLGSTLYYGNEDQVNLTLSNTPPTGYTFNGYAASNGGTITGTNNPYTLTMPDADVTVSATFAQIPVTYLNEHGDEAECDDYILLTGNETSIGNNNGYTWYVADGTINYTSKIIMEDNVNIILTDGAVVTVNVLETDDPDVAIESGILKIYGQSTGANKGQLNAYASVTGLEGSMLNIYGGQVTANGGSEGIHVENLTIYGGQVTATGNNDGITIYDGSVTINGGQVTANGNNGYGIRAKNNITLGWSDNTDFIHASSYHSVNGTISIASGKAFVTDEATPVVVSGTISDLSTINGKTLYPAVAVTLGEGITAGSGIITSGQNHYAQVGQTVTVEVTIPTSYTLSGITVTPSVALTNNPDGTYSFTVPAEDVTVSATFTLIPVTYLDGYGYEHQRESYTLLTGSETSIGTAGMETWYVAQGNLDNSSAITLMGHVHIILADGCQMNIGTEQSHINTFGIAGYGKSLSIYGQSTGTDKGQLNIYALEGIHTYPGSVTINGGQVTVNGDDYGIHTYGSSVTINGGQVTVTANNGSGISTYIVGSVTINGGQVTATGNDDGISTYNGSVTINGGQVTATVNDGSGISTYNGDVTINGGQVTANGYYGIYAFGGSVTINRGQVTATGNDIGIYAQNNYNSNSNSDITLGWTNTSDFIYANRYRASGTVSIAENKTFIDEDSNTYSGTIERENGAYSIDGKTLYPYIEGSVHYFDENGQRQLRLSGEYTTLTGNETTLGTEGEETWYVVDGTIDYSSPISLMGNTHIILKDNAVMNVGTEQTPINDYYGISDDNDNEDLSLSIYAQSTGADMGQLNVYVNYEYTNGIDISKDLTINGGQVTANGVGTQSVGFYVGESLTINGGQVTANGEGWGIYSSYGPVTINGGQVTATGTNYGILSYYGSIILGWTNATDYINVNRYNIEKFGTLSIAEGKTFIDEAGNTYESGTIEQVSGAYSINGKTLYPYIEPSTVTQTITLSEGWNWFSTNVEITLDDLKAALVEALPGTNITIKSKDNGQTIYNGTTWNGPLTTLDVTQMYRISVSAACEITLEGMVINPAQHPVTISNGVNWIGFPFSQSMSISEAFAGVEPVNGDKIISQDEGFAIYNGTTWSGTLQQLQPGNGYIYNSKATTTKYFTYPTNAR